MSATPNSMVADIFTGAELLKQQSVFQNYPDEQSLDNVTNGILQLYYSHWETKYIIDRSIWGLPHIFNTLKKFPPNDIKVIVPVRDLKEVIASFIKFSYKTKNNYIAIDPQTKRERSLEERFLFVMNNSEGFHKWINCVMNLIQPENKKYIYLMEYNDLVNNPEKTMSEIYKFLGIKPFKHKFKDLKQLKVNGLSYNDDELGKGLHTIKTDTVGKDNYDINDYLPADLSRYKLDPFWR